MKIRSAISGIYRMTRFLMLIPKYIIFSNTKSYSSSENERTMIEKMQFLASFQDFYYRVDFLTHKLSSM